MGRRRLDLAALGVGGVRDRVDHRLALAQRLRRVERAGLGLRACSCPATMLRALPPRSSPTFAVVSSSIRPSRISAIARAAAAIALRPSSGAMPEWASRPEEARVDAVLARRLEHHPADRRGVVEDVADARVQALDVERLGAAQADLLLRRQHELDARVRRCPPCTIWRTASSIAGDGRLVVGAEDPVLGVRHDAVAHDRADRRLRAAPCPCARRGRSAVPRLARRGRDPAVEVAGRAAERPCRVVLDALEAEVASGRRRSRSTTARSSPGGLGIRASSRNSSSTSSHAAATRLRGGRSRSRQACGDRAARPPPRRSRGTAAADASDGS